MNDRTDCSEPISLVVQELPILLLMNCSADEGLLKTVFSEAKEKRELDTIFQSLIALFLGLALWHFSEDVFSFHLKTSVFPGCPELSVKPLEGI